MPLEDLTGPTKYINALNSLNPDGATDRIDEGDDHLRGIKNVLKNTFPAITAAITATAAEINSWEARIAAREATALQPDALFPVGVVHITTDNQNPGAYLPGTWTQIAQGRTLIGEGLGAGLTSRVAGTELGQEDAILPDHTHPATQAAHRHKVPTGATSGNADTIVDEGDSPNATNVFTDFQTPAITVDSVGVDPTDGNMQPSLVVYFWERTA